MLLYLEYDWKKKILKGYCGIIPSGPQTALNIVVVCDCPTYHNAQEKNMQTHLHYGFYFLLYAQKIKGPWRKGES